MPIDLSRMPQFNAINGKALDLTGAMSVGQDGKLWVYNSTTNMFECVEPIARPVV